MLGQVDAHVTARKITPDHRPRLTMVAAGEPELPGSFSGISFSNLSLAMRRRIEMRFAPRRIAQLLSSLRNRGS
jgi:hypothetical protein